MPGAFWYSQPDRPNKRVLGAFDTAHVDDDDLRRLMEQIREDLQSLQRGCHVPMYGLRAHCWNPDVTRMKYGYYLAGFNETVLSAPLNGTRVVTLPDAVARPGGIVEVVDANGNAGTTAITVKTVKGQTINGAATFSINRDHLNVQFRSTGQQWIAIGQSPGTAAGTGNVTATNQFTADNRLIRTDRPTSDNRNVQQTGITVDDSDSMSGINLLNATTINATTGVFTSVETQEILIPGSGANTYRIGLDGSGNLAIGVNGGPPSMTVDDSGNTTIGDAETKTTIPGELDPEAVIFDTVDDVPDAQDLSAWRVKRDAQGRPVRAPRMLRGKPVKDQDGNAVMDMVLERYTKPADSLGKVFFGRDGKLYTRHKGKLRALKYED